MRRQSSITFIGVNSGTPVNEKLCGKYLQTFAYTTIKDRLPVILTKVIDQLARDKEEIIETYGSEAEECIKVAIGKISKLKNEVQTNKPLLPIESAEEDVAEWNSYLEDLEKNGPVSWYQTPWLYTENYMYRRLQEIFETSKSLKGFDPFRKQKIEAFEAALPQLAPIAQALKEKKDPSLDSFATALKLSLWSNRCDLSLSNGTVEAQEGSLLSSINELDKFVLADDSEKAFQALSKRSSKIVDFVHDNAAYELFTDLCVADYLITSGLAGTVRLRVKRFPWYVSDATPSDISWLIDRLPSEGLGDVADSWREHLSTKRWQILTDKFWTLPFAYSEMKTRDPALYSSLAEASIVIFKGDLNYRKLVGDVNWTFSEPFASALQGFRPSNILALRTIKADVVCGLTPGQTEVLFQKEPMWMRTGEYGIMQLSESADTLEGVLEEVPLTGYVDDDDEDDAIDEDEKRKSSTVSPRKWDIFRDIPTKEESGSQESVEYIEISVRVLKVLAYVVTFVMVFAGGVIAKTGLLLITAQLNPHPDSWESCLKSENNTALLLKPLLEERILWTWVLLFLLCIPELGTFLRASRIVFFKLNKMPEVRHFAVVATLETCHAVGTALLVFEVLPQLDAMRGAMLTNAVCFVPAVLRLLSRDTSEAYGMLKIGADAISVFFQFTALVIWPLYEQSARMGFIAPALLLASCGWWINFAPNTPPKGAGPVSAILRLLSEVKKGIQVEVRDERNETSLYWTYFFVSLWKMALYFGLMLAIIAVQYEVYGDEAFSVPDFFNKTDVAFQVHTFKGFKTQMITHTTLALYENEPVSFESGDLDWLYVGMVVAGGSYVAYIFSKFACKILIQEVGMALANLLVVPGTIALLAIFEEEQKPNVCFSQHFLPPYMFWTVDPSDDFIAEKLAWVWVLWLVSQAWITLHIWFPACERLAKTEKLFATPMYSGALTDQSICMNRTMDQELLADGQGENGDSDDSFPHVIACATMWHESKDEMIGFLKSILRLDLDHCARKAAKDTLRSATAKNNYYDFETQILLDDAFELESDGSSHYVVNQFVRDLMVALPIAVREVYASNLLKLAPADMVPTPYGGRLVYQLPGGTKLVVHLKDKQKIRHRKRWSQCMYMYYLLGYLLMDTDMPIERKELRAQNTFLLALDGDIDFQPKAVQLLVDLMKKNPNLGAACGRIHPVGSGLMAWYQMFEYAIGHWLQKATEHMIGCVLCSPGCFSLFRGKALMDDNVMRTYTKNCEAARHYVQYDQGEDRWLCTLLLQRGYRIEYSAASDAYTHCPENFNEFYNQRRRWVPSTMANIMDLLGSYKRTIEVNGNVSFPYIMYQTMLLGGTILGPGTIFLMLVGAFVAAFKIDNWSSFLYNLIPILLFIGVCLFLSSNVQLIFALVISTVYGLIMMAVLVGILIQIQEDGPLAPSTLFLFIVAGEIIVAGLMHPQEVYCLPSGTIYYITIPSMYLLLIIYSVCNLNVVSWGTREVAAKKTKKELEEEKMAAALQTTSKKQPSGNAILAFLESIAPGKGKEKGSIDLSFAGLFRCMLCTQPEDFDEREHLLRIGDSLVNVNKRLDSIERCVDPTSMVPSRRRTTISRHPSNLDLGGPGSVTEGDIEEEDEEETEVADDRDDLLNPYWMEDYFLRKLKTKFLPSEESKFWVEFIKRYLEPIDEDVDKQKKIAADLRELRDKTVLTFFMLNALFVIVVFLLQLNKDTIFINWPLGIKSNITYVPNTNEVEVTQDFLQLEPIGLLFVIFFAIILVIQFTGMFLHRFETLCHLLSTTTIFTTKESGFSVEKMIESAKIDIQKQDDTNIDQKMDGGDVVSRRKTIKTLEEAFNEAKRPSSVNLQDAFKSLYAKKQADEDKANEAKEERRRSSIGNKLRSSRRLSTAPRSSSTKRVTMAHTNLAFIQEEERE